MGEPNRRGSMSTGDAAQAEDACGMLAGLDPSLGVRRGSISGRRASMSRAPLVDANQRAKEDAAYSSFLLDIGNGDAPVYNAIGPSTIRLPPPICAPATWTLRDLVENVYPNFAEHFRCCACTVSGIDAHTTFFRDRAVLVPRNALVDEINQFSPEHIIIDLSSLQPLRTYYSPY